MSDLSAERAPKRTSVDRSEFAGSPPDLRASAIAATRTGKRCAAGPDSEQEQRLLMVNCFACGQANQLIDFRGATRVEGPSGVDKIVARKN
jgi:hypothetical protein